MRRLLRSALKILAGILLLLLLLAGISAVANRVRPKTSTVVDHLSEAEKVRIAEVIQLRRQVGDKVWDGWGSAEIPLIIYNEDYAFLLNYAGQPPVGWIEVPAMKQHGQAWETVPDDTFSGAPYYRQALTEDNKPQAFAMRVGEEWVAGMTTYEWTRIRLANDIADQMPGVLKAIFPYALFVNELINGVDHYVPLVEHETLHAFQGNVAPTKLLAGEQARSDIEDSYPWDNDAFIDDWQAELDLLADSLEADSAEKHALAQQFIAHRDARRLKAGLEPAQIAYEQQREWVEGAAKYTELAIWEAAGTHAYEPNAALTADTDFDNYNKFEQQRGREIDQTRRMATDIGDGRFYYSGWAQAVLLDDLMPEWKTRYFEEGTTLESLLREAIDS